MIAVVAVARKVVRPPLAQLYLEALARALRRVREELCIGEFACGEAAEVRQQVHAVSIRRVGRRVVLEHCKNTDFRHEDSNGIFMCVLLEAQFCS